MKTSGVYSIINKSNGKIYIGSSSNIQYRFNVHLYRLRKGNHANQLLQAAWNKYGEKSFIFELIEIVVDKTKIIEREQHYIDILNTAVPYGYNIRKIASSNLGCKHSDEAKFKISCSSKARRHSEETRRKIGEIHKGLHHTDESKIKISINRTGIVPKWINPIARSRKISESRKGYIMPQSTKDKLSKAHKGKSKFTQEIKNEMHQLFIGGMSRKAIAEKIGADRHIVSNILKQLQAGL
jgi:group I intron endonuclease